MPLPPGLNGFALARDQQSKDQMQQLQSLGLLSGLQSHALEQQLMPLKLQQLQLAVNRAQANNDLFHQVTSGMLGGGGSSPLGALSAGAEQGDVGPTATNAARIGQPAPNSGMLNAPALIQAMLLSGDAGMGKYGQSYLEQNKPVATREGAPVVNPNTGQVMFFAPKLEPGMVPTFNGNQLTGVSNAPGYISSMNERNTAQERTKAGFDLVTTPPLSPTSPPTRGSRLQALEGAGAVPVRGTAPTDAEAIRRVQEADVQGQPASVDVRPMAIPAERVLGNAAGMSPAVEGDTNAANEFKKKAADSYAKMYSEMNNASMKNPAKIAKFERIGSLLGDYEGGKLSNAGFELARTGNSLGITIDKNLPNKEAAEALSKEVALDLRSTAEGNGMPGSLSDADREFLRSMTPQMASTAQGRKQIIESRTALMRREMEVSDMARKYVKKYGSLNEDFFSQLQAWSNGRPMFKK